MLATLAQVRLVSLPNHAAESGDLVVMQGGEAVPFQISRVFLVQGREGADRGEHAHKQCSQFMVCTAGRVDVTCDDGSSRSTFVLDSARQGLLVPPGVWAAQSYVVDGSALLVLCDRPYEADDYIRDYSRFVEYRAHSPRLASGVSN